MIDLIRGDCFERLKDIPDCSIDLILTDPPYGTTACKWDSDIDLEALWKELNRIAKMDSAIVLFGSQPFTSKLISSNMTQFKYCWVWEKSRCGNPYLAKYQPLKYHEDIAVFSKGKCPYNPQGLLPFEKMRKQRTKVPETVSGGTRPSEYYQKNTNYPRSVVRFNSLPKTVHPTQKPIELLEYLIRTYTKTGDTVLDYTMGSGSTGVAAMNVQRDFVGIELDESYFKIAKQRIEDAVASNRFLGAG